MLRGRAFERVLKGGCRAVLFFAGVRVDVAGRENVVPGRQYVAVMNHVNFFDPMVFQVAFPYAARGVEEESHFRWPVYGATLKRMGMFPIDRKDSGQAIETMRRAADWLRRKPDFSFGVMPEGTRTLDGKLGPFKRGGFILAVETGLDILPLVQSRRLRDRPQGQPEHPAGKGHRDDRPAGPVDRLFPGDRRRTRRTRPRHLSRTARRIVFLTGSGIGSGS